jgi:adenine-specific DNA-methyltransferase
LIKYLGSKRLLIPSILDELRALPQPVRSVLDVFSGTSRVGHALKREGYRVIANDHNRYAATLARCYVQADRGSVEREAEMLLRELGALPGRAGYFTETFCEKARFFQPKNGERVDAIRDAIEAKSLAPELKAVALTSLMEAADRVDSTTGVQMAYLKQWAQRAHNDLSLRMPDVLPRAKNGAGVAEEREAMEVVEAHEVDVAYLDPPYNQHKYLGNYHVWETLVRWDHPETYGIAQKRIDAKVRRSDFNSKPAFLPAFEALIAAVRARHLIVSFSDEGFLSRADAERVLSRRGSLRVVEHDYKRYVGAQIGIFNPAGDKVGKVSHLRNTEQLFVVTVH